MPRSILLLAAALTAAPTAPAALAQTPTSSALLRRLPDGVEKRRFILDCTGCHQFDAVILGENRTRAEWAEAVERMLGFSGAASSFPVISAYRNAASTAEWLERELAANRPVPTGPAPIEGRAEITEFPMSNPGDLLHDLAVDDSGRVVVTGMFSGAMFVLDPATRAVHRVATPGPQPRAVELDSGGNWWVLLGSPPQLAVFDVTRRTWRTVALPAYPHSLGLDAQGRAWFNGHFTHDPEIIGWVQSGAVRTDTVPPHPTMAPTPYELRVGPDGRVWMSELQGNRIVGYTPATGVFETFDLPTPFGGPRRFDLDGDGVLWIPAYAANLLVRFDPRSRRFEEIPFPEPDVLPYVARVDRGTGLVWIGTAAADAAYSFDPRTRRFTRYGLPSRGALVRHLDIDPRTHDVWLAYGASPGRISARIARLRPQP